MVPMPNYTTVDEKPLKQLVVDNKITQKRLDEIIERTRKGGGEINQLLVKASAFYAPATAGVEMAESYIKNLKKILPCAAYLNGEYGVKNLYAGVPVTIGSNGVEKIEELSLNEQEKLAFKKSISAVNNLWLSACKIDPALK